LSQLWDYVSNHFANLIEEADVLEDGLPTTLLEQFDGFGSVG
jgi:hypothetical protein